MSTLGAQDGSAAVLVVVGAPVGSDVRIASHSVPNDGLVTQ